MEERAQINVEYLLIVVGAIAIATIVGLFIKQTASSVTEASKQPNP